MGRGYGGDGDVGLESSVRRTSESCRVLIRDGDVWKSRFEGEIGLFEGVWPVMEISEELVWLWELSRVSEEVGSNEPGGIGKIEVENTVDISDAINTGDAGDTGEICDAKGRTVESGAVNVD